MPLVVDKFKAQCTHWVPHPTFVWLPGKQLVPPDGLAFQTSEGNITVETGKVLDPILNDWSFQGVDDVCLLPDMSEATLLHSLRTRYMRDEIYTYISVILMAVNPFKRLALYSSQNIELHRTAEDMQMLLPHIFGVA